MAGIRPARELLQLGGMRITYLGAAVLSLLAACLPEANPGVDAAPAPASTDAPVACNYHGTLYADGAEFPANDGCNNCKCNPSGTTPGLWGCSLKRCPSVDAPVACNYKGTSYPDGAEFPADDGCNNCKCNPSGTTPGQWGCTAKACPSP
jgi:hypothetical protein